MTKVTMRNKHTTIYVVRHGESDANIRERFTEEDFTRWGEYESDLTEKGIEQGKAIAQKLRPVHFEAIFSSDLTRARHTAELIAEGRNMPVATNASIRERKYGKEFFLMTKEQRHELKSALYELNEEEKFNHKFFPHGESAKDAAERFHAFLKEIIPLYTDKTVLVVNHGAVMRMFLVSIGWGTFDELTSNTVQNTGYFVLQTDGNEFTITETDGIVKKTHTNE
jgi:broad specificity phosphatase PhoE